MSHEKSVHIKERSKQTKKSKNCGKKINHQLKLYSHPPHKIYVCIILCIDLILFLDYIKHTVCMYVHYSHTDVHKHKKHTLSITIFRKRSQVSGTRYICAHTIKLILLLSHSSCVRTYLRYRYIHTYNNVVLCVMFCFHFRRPLRRPYYPLGTTYVCTKSTTFWTPIQSPPAQIYHPNNILISFQMYGFYFFLWILLMLLLFCVEKIENSPHRQHTYWTEIQHRADSCIEQRVNIYTKTTETPPSGIISVRVVGFLVGSLFGGWYVYKGRCSWSMFHYCTNNIFIKSTQKIFCFWFSLFGVFLFRCFCCFSCRNVCWRSRINYHSYGDGILH